MLLRVRKVGNSAAVLLPVPLIEEWGACVGDDLEASIKNGVLTMKRAKPNYRLHELLAQCDQSAQAPDDMLLCHGTAAVGNEAW